jgi:hypothetical protein
LTAKLTTGSGSPPQSTQTAGRLVTEHYPAIAAELLKPLIHLLSIARDACGGDAEKYLILLVVNLRSTEHPDFQASTQDGLRNHADPVLPGLGTNVRSLSESLNIPRETARRKVAELIETGWIARRGTSLHYTRQAFRQLTPIREALAALAVANFQVVADLLRQHPGADRTD